MTTTPSYLEAGDSTIAYHHHEGPAAKGVMFLGGFKSNMQGGKALALDAYCRANGIPFTRFDYGGHGASSGRFEDGTIGLWQAHALAVFDRVADRPQILVGSSMGGWMMLLLALARRSQVAGLVGIASAPDFTEKLIWDALQPDQLAEMRDTGRIVIRNCMAGEEDYPITQRLIDEGRQHLLTEKPIAIDCSVHLIHGMLDADVPYTMSLQLADAITRPDVAVTLVKDGDHRMARPENLALICDVVGRVAQAV